MNTPPASTWKLSLLILGLEGAREVMESQGRGHWGWVVGIGLLVADIALPIPSTVVMSALGWMYGWWWGGLAAGAGSFLSGVIAYALCRWLGRPAARWIAGEDGLRRGEELFQKRGGWLVALSRWMPVLPEAVACLAGLVRMPWRPFGHSSPAWALLLSALLPIALWLLARRILRR